MEPGISASASIRDDSLYLEYQLTNGLDVPILVFDRLYNLAKQSLDMDWYYAQFGQGSIVLTRMVWPLPPGLRHENPEVPYGRMIKPGESLAGEISITLPVQETDPYYEILHRDTEMIKVEISRLELRLGWCVATDLPPGGWVSLNDEELYLYDYFTVISKQQVVMTDPISARIYGLASR